MKERIRKMLLIPIGLIWLLLNEPIYFLIITGVPSGLIFIGWWIAQ
jgi:hypothetical protein